MTKNNSGYLDFFKTKDTMIFYKKLVRVLILKKIMKVNKLIRF